MPYQRIAVERRFYCLIVRFLPPARRQRYDGRELRDELVRLVRENPSQILIVDFGDFQLYPAELLGCLAHVRQYRRSRDPVRCVNLPLRLQTASRFLKFEGSVLRNYASLSDALPIQGAIDVTGFAPVAFASYRPNFAA